MANEKTEQELLDLMDSLTVNDSGPAPAVASGGLMNQKDIDYLVGLLRELQQYREIGTPEECAEYKKKALG